MDYFELQAIAEDMGAEVDSESEFAKIVEVIDLFCKIIKIKEHDIYTDSSEYDRCIDRINELFIQLNRQVVSYAPEKLPCHHLINTFFEWEMGLVPDYDAPFEHYSDKSDIIKKIKKTIESKIEQTLQDIFNAYEGFPFSEYLEHKKG